MKKASWSLLVILAASLTSWQSFAQVRPHNDHSRDSNRPLPPVNYPQPLPQTNYPQPLPQEEMLEVRIQQSLSRGQRIRLSQYLYARDPRSQIVSITITAQSFAGPSNLQLLSNGSVLELIPVRRQIAELPVRSISLGSLEMLELSAIDDVYIESISARVRSAYLPIPQPLPDLQVAANSLVSLRVNQDFYNGGQLSLDQLAHDQLGQSLQGAQIERVAIEGVPTGRGAGIVQIELNGRIAGSRSLFPGHRMQPIQIGSLEEVRTLKLIVQGSAQIMSVNIRIGNVRPQGNPRPLPQQFPNRILVNQEIGPSFPLDLSIYSRDLSLVRSLTLETTLRGYAGGELTLITRQGYTVGRALVAQGRTVILLTTPTALADLRIYAQSPVLVGSIESELDRPIVRR